jgi:trimeric autotransporter adhesin
MKAAFCCIGLLLALMLATGCGSSGGSQPNSATSTPSTSSIQVSPGSVSVGVSGTQQFIATAHLSDGTTKDVTSAVQWGSSDSNVASVNATGMATGAGVGSATITAQSGSLQGLATLSVSAAAGNLVSITVAAAVSSMAVNTSQQFTATGNYNDGSSADLTNLVTWSSSSTATATVGSTGLVTAVAAGTTNVSASYASLSGSLGLTVTAPSIVSIAVTPEDLTLGIGIGQQYVATATYSDGSSSDLSSGVTWSSSATSVTIIDNSGVAATVGAGSTTITATVGSLSDSSILTVVPAHLISIAVSPSVQSIALGTKQQFTAVGTFDDGSTQLLPSATWSSSLTSVASVDVNGMASSISGGIATITATSGVISGTASLTVTAASLVSISVTPAQSTMAVGTTKQFTATGSFSDSSTQDISASAVWSSSTPATATINNTGLVSSVATGSTTVKASVGGISGSTGLTVSTAHLVSITVNPSNARIVKGTAIKFTATGTFSDGSTATNLSGVSWKSSKPSVVSIRSFGRASGKKTGTVTITASVSGIKGTASLTVGSGTLVSLAVTPSAPTVLAGGTQQFTATGTFTDGSTQDITLNAHWSSSSSSVATIANAPSAIPGLAQCLAPGSSAMGANSGGITGSAILTIQ